MSLVEKAAIITGASRGIGKEIADRLCQLGYQVGLVARDRQQLNVLRQNLNEKYKLSVRRSPIVLPVDVTETESVYAAIDEFCRFTGRVDVLVNNAGLLIEGTTSLEIEAFEQLYRTNVVGVFNCCKTISKIMKKQQSGYIINIASSSGKVAQASLGGYAASKFALVGFSEALMKEMSEYNIKVTTICPNLVSTDMTKHINIMPHEKMIPTEDIANTIEYLLKLSSHTIVPEVNLDCMALLKYR